MNSATGIPVIVSPHSSELWRSHVFVTRAGSGSIARISIRIISGAGCTRRNWTSNDWSLPAQQLLLRRTTSRSALRHICTCWRSPREKTLLQSGMRPGSSSGLFANTVVLEWPWQRREPPHRPCICHLTAPRAG